MFLQKNNKKIINHSNENVKIDREENILIPNKLDFRISLKQSANLDIDNGNGYGIAKINKLGDMI